MNHVSEAAVLRTRKPRGQGASRRGEILEAAKRLFTEEGFAHATMRRIASVVGVSPTALYLHFSDKEAILQATAEEFFSELLVELHRAQTGVETPLARLRAGMKAFVMFSLDRADEYRLTFQTKPKALPQPPHSGDVENVADMSFAVLENAVAELLAAGYFRKGDPCVIAETIFACLHGVTSAVMDLADRMQCGREALIDSVIDTTLRGLTCPNAGPTA